MVRCTVPLVGCWQTKWYEPNRVRLLTERSTRALDRQQFGSSPKASFAPLKRVIKKLHLLEVNCLAQHLAGGSWTADKIAARGEDYLPECTPCGAPGTLAPRVWKCPAWPKDRLRFLKGENPLACWRPGLTNAKFLRWDHWRMKCTVLYLLLARTECIQMARKAEAGIAAWA
eukprot:4100416-Amphidinium_carterae.1